MGTRAWWLVVALLLVVLPTGTSLAGGAQKVTIVMGEDGARMFFRPSRITLQAGVEAKIVLTNRGKLKHEFMLYATPTPGMARDALHAWAEERSYFREVEVKVEGGGLEVAAKQVLEVELAAGKTVEITFAPKTTGTFEMGCLIRQPVDHYAAGMKGTVVIR